MQAFGLPPGHTKEYVREQNREGKESRGASSLCQHVLVVQSDRLLQPRNNGHQNVQEVIDRGVAPGSAPTEGTEGVRNLGKGNTRKCVNRRLASLREGSLITKNWGEGKGVRCTLVYGAQYPIKNFQNSGGLPSEHFNIEAKASRHPHFPCAFPSLSFSSWPKILATAV